MDDFSQSPDTPASPEEPAAAPSTNRFAGLRAALMDVLETILLSVVLFGIINLISARIRVESISMEPTLVQGQFLYVNKLAYRFAEPQIGEVIVFKYPPDPTQQYIKRIIGLPGDKVFISGGKVYVNDVPLVEPYIKAPPNYTGNWEVPAEALFVLGDNRNRSMDSHVWGMVPLDDVIGKAEFVYWPLTQIRWLGEVQP
ncbi:MAG: signal peptidase I [Anaerolineales bacterium]